MQLEKELNSICKRWTKEPSKIFKNRFFSSWLDIRVIEDTKGIYIVYKTTLSQQNAKRLLITDSMEQLLDFINTVSFKKISKPSN